MGYAKTPLNPPSEYLKKGANSKPPVNAIKPQPFKYPVNTFSYNIYFKFRAAGSGIGLEVRKKI